MNEVENTMRTLGEKQLLVKSRWCYVGWHRWTQYAKPVQRKEGIFIIDYQVRHCDSCGLYDRKTIRSFLG